MAKRSNIRSASGYATVATRNQAIQRVLAGESPEAVIKEFGFHRSRIYAWLKDYRKQQTPTAPEQTEDVYRDRSQQEWQRKTSTEGVAPPPLLVSHLNDWILLLNQSLLNLEHPLSSFVELIGLSAKGPAIIATDLHSPTVPVRAIYQDASLSNMIEFNKMQEELWCDTPFVTAMKKPGEVKFLTDLIPYDQWHKNKYCSLHMAAGAKEAVALSFSGVKDILSCLIIYQWQKKPLDEETRKFLLALRPHLEVAMALAVNHWHNNFTVTALEEATANLQIATFLLDGSGNIIKYSGTAEDILQRQNHLKLGRNQLNFSSADNQTAFKKAVERAMKWRREPLGNKPVEVMHFTYEDDTSLGVLVRPITPPSLALPHAIPFSPHVAVYINDPHQPSSAPKNQLIMRLFNLTLREAKLTTLLTEGYTIADAASEMNITLSTARSYLQHIYEKVGINRRQDLVQRVMKSVALLA